MSPRVGGLFEGYGGLTRAVQDTLGGDLAWYSEIDPAACKVLAHHHPRVPNLGDITAVPWAELDPVDVLTGGFPCQDVSAAGRRAGMTPDSRSGLWTHMARAINVLRPRLVVIENVRGLLSADAACDVEPCPWCLGDDEGRPLRALGAVLGDLAVIGYDARWCGVRASDAGAPHGRFRIIIVAWPAPDADESGHERPIGPLCISVGQRQAAVGARATATERGGAVADAAGQGRAQRVAQHVNVDSSSTVRAGQAQPGRRDSATSADSDCDGLAGGAECDQWAEAGQQAPLGGDAAGRVLDWGDYGPAIRRWELILGRPAPAPTVTGRRGGQQLAPAFVEWLMGLPAGHVTDVPGLSRNDQLKLLGNGVVPQQAELALWYLLGPTAARAPA